MTIFNYIAINNFIIIQMSNALLFLYRNKIQLKFLQFVNQFSEQYSILIKHFIKKKLK